MSIPTARQPARQLWHPAAASASTQPSRPPTASALLPSPPVPRPQTARTTLTADAAYFFQRSQHGASRVRPPTAQPLPSRNPVLPSPTEKLRAEKSAFGLQHMSAEEARPELQALKDLMRTYEDAGAAVARRGASPSAQGGREVGAPAQAASWR